MKLNESLKVFAATGVLAFAGMPAFADVIDFESGFSNLDPVGVVGTATNSVTFSVGGGGTGFIANVGQPRTAFVSDDSPAGLAAGDFFLTDETAGPDAALDYFMVFSDPVLDLSLDLYDYRDDGGPAVGDTATLTVFSDTTFTTSVGSFVFTILGDEVDGNVQSLSVLAPTGLILSASLVMSDPDVGTGIDNITFTSKVAEPVSLVLLGLGLVGIGLARGRRRYV